MFTQEHFDAQKTRNPFFPHNHEKRNPRKPSTRKIATKSSWADQQRQWILAFSSAAAAAQLSLQFAVLPGGRVPRHDERAPVHTLPDRLPRGRAQLPQVPGLQRPPLLRGRRLHRHAHRIHVSLLLNCCLIIIYRTKGIRELLSGHLMNPLCFLG